MKRFILVVVAVLVVGIHFSFAQDDFKIPCSIEVSGEAGVHSSYNDRDLGETIYPGRVGQQWVEVEICGNKKVSFGAWEWTSSAFRKNARDGAEVDAVGFFNFRTGERTNVRVEAGVYFVPDGQIQRFSNSVFREMQISEKDTAEFENTVVYFRTSENLPYKGGVVNRTSLTANKTIFKDKLTLSLGSGFGFDNNPFALGQGRFVLMTFTNGRISYNVNGNFSLYVEGMLTAPALGVTDRGVRKGGSFGFTFNF